jgi:hypothetical protein
MAHVYAVAHTPRSLHSLHYLHHSYDAYKAALQTLYQSVCLEHDSEAFVSSDRECESLQKFYNIL